MKALEIVVFEDTGQERMVFSQCRLCAKTWPRPRSEAFAVVSPHGVAHVGVDYGRTACGKDATGDDWWWPL